MQPMKNVAASAKSGMEKTKATVQEKAEKMTSRDPVEKEEAAQKKDARIAQAELEKQEARAHNTAAGTGQPTGSVTQGVVGSHPLGSNTATGRTTAHNSGTGPRTGGTY